MLAQAYTGHFWRLLASVHLCEGKKEVTRAQKDRQVRDRMSLKVLFSYIFFSPSSSILPGKIPSYSTSNYQVNVN